MIAVRYDTFEGPLRLVEVPDPTPTPDGVVVRVGTSGLCRSDWHGWKGHDADVKVPHVPGHEFAGTVIATGKEVRKWTHGDRVTVPFSMGCGACERCRAGDEQICDRYYEPGFTGWGAFAEFVALPYADVNLVRLPPPRFHDLHDGRALGVPLRDGVPRCCRTGPHTTRRMGGGARLVNPPSTSWSRSMRRLMYLVATQW